MTSRSNMRFFYLIVLWLLGATTSVADSDFNGHLKPLVNVASYPQNSVWRDSGATSASLSLEGRLNGMWSGQTTRLNVAWQGFATYQDSGETQTLPLGGNLTSVDDSRRLFDFTSRVSEYDRGSLNHRLDRLSLHWSTDNNVVSIGRQALSWGNGLFFSPMDIVNPFDPVAIDTEYKTGDDMIYAQHLFTSGNDIQAALVFRRDPASHRVDADESTLGVKYHGLLGDGELDLLAAINHQTNVIGVGGNRLLGDAVWRADLVLTEVDDDWYGEFTSNLSYSWVWATHNVSASLEYYYNSFGQPTNKYDVANLSQNHVLVDRLARGESYTIGRHYAAGNISVELSPLTIVSTNLFANLQDNSGLLQLTLQSFPTDNASFTIAMSVPLGPAGSEYGGIQSVDPGVYYARDLALFLQFAWYR
jgi:hypothetical protein